MFITDFNQIWSSSAYFHNVPNTKSKGKIHPRTCHEGPEGEQKYSSTFSLTSALVGVKWSTPRPGRFTPEKRPGTRCVGGWVGPRAGLDGCEKSRPPTGIRSPESRVAIPTKLSRPLPSSKNHENPSSGSRSDIC